MKQILVLSIAFVHHVKGNNNDLFNYRETDDNDYGPEDWDQVTCDDVEICTGWPDDWRLGVDWELTRNDCRWCPEGSDNCGGARQSPIDLERNRALEGTDTFNQCIDVHWMKYEDSSCTWEDLDSKNAFIIERHGLKILQPLEYDNGGDNGIRLDCTPGSGDERRFGRIDFSKGFSDWWFLSHIDIKVPSEHSQEGRTYSAEVQMAHFYSLSKEASDSDNKMGTVAVFLQAYDDSPPYPHLDRLICEWRKAEDRTREACGLRSVDPYPGCFDVARGRTPFPSEGPLDPTSAPISPTLSPTTGVPIDPTIPPVGIPGAPTPSPTAMPVGTKTPTTSSPTSTPSLVPTLKPPPSPFPTVPSTPNPLDLVTLSPIASPALAPVAPTVTEEPTSAPTDNVRKLRKSFSDVVKGNFSSPKTRKQRIVMDEINYRPADRTDEEWKEWIAAYSAHGKGEASDHQRELLEQSQLSFHNYQFLIDVRTEYYFRYSGTSTVPPCYGKFDGSRANTNHWRVLKDPIRVAPRQIAELERLLRERIAPPDDQRKACKKDTAGKVDADGHISVARPLQQFDDRHYLVFCECDDWPSKWPEDREWCSINQGDKRSRFYDHPYNYKSEGYEV